MSPADPPGRPVWGWRLLAWATLILLVLMQLPDLLAAGPTTWAGTALNWIAVAGLFSYSYGREPRFLMFWRVFALPFSFYTVAMLGILAGGAIRYARYDAGPAPVAAWILIAATFVVCLSMCIALLRHAQLLRGRQRATLRDLEGVFA